MSTEERVTDIDIDHSSTYRDRLAEAAKLAFADRVDAEGTRMLSGSPWKALDRALAAAAAVRDAELDRLTEENTRRERDELKVIAERDQLEELLDQFAYAVAPVEVIGEHSSGNDPWRNALDMVTPVAEVGSLREENTRLAAELAVAQRKRDHHNEVANAALKAWNLVKADYERAEAQLAETNGTVEDLRRTVEDLSSRIDRALRVRTYLCGSNAVKSMPYRDVVAILDNPPPGDTPEPNRSGT